MNRRRLFGLAGGVAATAAVPAIAAPVVEMVAADIAPVRAEPLDVMKHGRMYQNNLIHFYGAMPIKRESTNG